MMPAKLDLDLYRGDSRRWQFQLWRDAEKTIPADLTDITPKAEIRDTHGGADVTELPTTKAGNVVEMTLPAAHCSCLPAKGVWDLQMTYDIGGDVVTIIAGNVSVTADVTDSTRTDDVQGRAVGLADTHCGETHVAARRIAAQAVNRSRGAAGAPASVTQFSRWPRR